MASNNSCEFWQAVKAPSRNELRFIPSLVNGWIDAFDSLAEDEDQLRQVKGDFRDEFLLVFDALRRYGQWTWEVERMPSYGRARLAWWSGRRPSRLALLLASQKALHAERRVGEWSTLRRMFDWHYADFRRPFFREATWLTAEGMTCDPFLRRLSRRWRFGLRLVKLPRKQNGWHSWLRSLQQKARALSKRGREPRQHSAVCASSVILSPSFGFSVASDDVERRLSQVKLGRSQRRGCWEQPTSSAKGRGIADDVLASIVDEVCFLAVARTGTVRSLLNHYSARPPNDEQRIWLIDSQLDVVPENSSQIIRLSTPLNFGVADSTIAAPFTPSPSWSPSPMAVKPFPSRAERSRVAALIERGLLSHWTRASPRRFRGQLVAETIDAMLWQTDDAERSALATLKRIVRTGQLKGTARWNRFAASTVSLTAVPLVEFPVRRTFRRHLHRWDFESFGVAFDRKWLIGQGARSVIYGDDETRSRLSLDRLPYFQQRFSRPNEVAEIDWSQEMEWRYLGDLSFADVPVDRVLIFVRRVADAVSISQLCDFPVAILKPL